MSKDNSGGHAFPWAIEWTDNHGNHTVEQNDGLTKRELFAMAAMQGMLTGTLGMFSEPSGEKFSPYCFGHCNAEIANRAVVIADALLAELAK